MYLLDSLKANYSKTCLKRNLKGPEHVSAEASFRLITVYYDKSRAWKYLRLDKIPFNKGPV
jgi:hypothetical protein